jgi:16S rRNA (uracil1498-N3)-methyltransferase
VTRRRWIADEFDDARAWLLGSNAVHLARVLRARAGQQFDIVCGPRLRLGTLVSISDERVEFALSDLPEDAAEEQRSLPAAGQGSGERQIVLLTAIYKFDRMEWAIEKCTELGVTKIVPVVARRTDSHLAAAATKRVERWRRIAHEAAQQSRRMAPPQIEDPINLTAALDLASIAQATKLLLNENERSESLREALAGTKEALAFAIGPEGGWTEKEIAEFTAAGWRSVTLGSTILRSETAAIATLAAAAAILG